MLPAPVPRVGRDRIATDDGSIGNDGVGGIARVAPERVATAAVALDDDSGRTPRVTVLYRSSDEGRTVTDRPTILIVDDTRPLADLFASFLEERFGVRTAYSGREALDRIDPSVDAVLLDRRMPHLTGDDIVRELREKGGNCRVAMVSGVEPIEDVRDLGYDRFIDKDHDPESLVAAVEALLDDREDETHASDR